MTTSASCGRGYKRQRAGCREGSADRAYLTAEHVNRRPVGPQLRDQHGGVHRQRSERVEHRPDPEEQHDPEAGDAGGDQRQRPPCLGRGSGCPRTTSPRRRSRPATGPKTNWRRWSPSAAAGRAAARCGRGAMPRRRGRGRGMPARRARHRGPRPWSNSAPAISRRIVCVDMCHSLYSRRCRARSMGDNRPARSAARSAARSRLLLAPGSPQPERMNTTAWNAPSAMASGERLAARSGCAASASDQADGSIGCSNLRRTGAARKLSATSACPPGAMRR